MHLSDLPFAFNTLVRGEQAAELLGLCKVFDVKDTSYFRKGFNQRMADVMANQLIELRYDLGEIKLAAPNADFGLFEEVPCNYGERIGSQLQKVIDAIRKDRETRRALIVLAKPEDEVPPCILNLQFLVRVDPYSKKEGLVLVVFMRSWDGYLGLPYDVYTMQNLNKYVASLVGTDPDCVVFMVASSHIYEKDSDKWA